MTDMGGSSWVKCVSSLLHGTAARMNTVVETEVVDNLNKEQTTRRSEYDNFS